MGLVDVSELLVDPDFVDPMAIIFRVPTVNSFGENSTVETTLDTIGSIQPASGKALNRLPEALRIENMMSFWYKGDITVSGPGKYPSVLVFKGNRYQVKNVFDWSNWGAGWSEGLCVQENIS